MAEVLPVELPCFLLRWFESKSTPHAIVDRQGRLYWANKAAASAKTGAIDISENMVRARPRTQQDALAAAIEGASTTSSTVVLGGDDGHTMVEFADVGDAARPLIGIKWWLADSSFEVRYAALDVVFQLTPAEHSILFWLARGHTADEVATVAGISLQTVRSHIRQIYAKLNVRSREEMFFRIQPFRI